jgi:hypothetical protein
MYMQMQMVYDCDWNRLSGRLTATLRVPDSRGSFAFDFWHPAPRGTGYLAAIVTGFPAIDGRHACAR